MPDAVSILASPEQMAAIKFDAAGLVPVIAQDVHTRSVLMMAWMNAATLAATLAANYGIYGPAYELMEHEARDPGGEEYLDSEKYQVRRWDLDRADSLKDYIARLNRIRNKGTDIRLEALTAPIGIHDDQDLSNFIVLPAERNDALFPELERALAQQ